jgi:hypothetical protein
MLVALLELPELALAATVERLFLVQLHRLVAVVAVTSLRHQVLAVPVVPVAAVLLAQLTMLAVQHRLLVKEMLEGLGIHQLVRGLAAAVAALAQLVAVMLVQVLRQPEAWGHQPIQHGAQQLAQDKT